MKSISKTIIALSLILAYACNSDSKKQTASNMEKQNLDNPLLKEWTGPYGGVPAFDKMELADLEAAIKKGIELHLLEIDSIANQDEAPTFENTILAMEKSGEPLGRAFTYYGIWSSNLSSPEFREIQEKLAPKISEYSSKISQNEKLFQRIKSVYQNRSKLDSAQQRVVELIYQDFVMEGANLNEADKKRYAEINEELSKLYTQFSNNVLAEEKNYVVYLNENQLGGLPESYVKSAAKSASEREHEGEYAVLNTRSSMDPFLTYSTERELREKVWRNYYSRGDNDDEFDNKKIIMEILKLRDERVGLLGFENYAQWRLQDRMAKNPENAMELMMKVWPAALARVEEEVTDMQAIADSESAGITIKPWDYRYYAEKVRQKKYDFESDVVKQYLQLEKLKHALFFVAGKLFNYEFKPVPEGSVPVFHEDVEVWEVTDKSTGEHIGLWYFDPFARTGKRSGAWATTYRSHTNLEGKEETVLGSNNSNFIQPASGEPVLISWGDAETLFHEFGHALHFFASNVKYPTLNSGVRDYTEFQSQLLERWLTTDAVIDSFLVHHETGKPIPDELVAKIKKASTFNQGFATTEYLASALIDMILHTIEPSQIENLSNFVSKKLDSLNMPEEIPMRHRETHFSHIFSGEGYSAGYYGYLWAEVLTADAAEAFANAPGGFYDPELSHKLKKYLFAPRNAIEPSKAYELFRGRDAKIDALMRDRGFPVPEGNSEKE
jgi:peptidyl-dipeptidase Dcp